VGQEHLALNRLSESSAIVGTIEELDCSGKTYQTEEMPVYRQDMVLEERVIWKVEVQLA